MHAAKPFVSGFPARSYRELTQDCSPGSLAVSGEGTRDRKGIKREQGKGRKEGEGK